MKLLELFSGTGSVGKVAKELGYDVVWRTPTSTPTSYNGITNSLNRMTLTSSGHHRLVLNTAEQKQQELEK